MHPVAYPWLLLRRGALTNTPQKKLIGYPLIEPPLASGITTIIKILKASSETSPYRQRGADIGYSLVFPGDNLLIE
jgi:hypothetical protein